MKFILLVIFLIFASPLWAADYYVTPTGAGSTDGSNCANGMNWSTMTFVRGDTYYLCTGTYGAKTLDTAVSGTTYIYLKPTNGLVTFSSVTLTISTNYWDIDGVTGGGPTAWTSGHGIKFTSAAGTGINYVALASGSDHIIIRRTYFEAVGDTTAYGAASAASAIYCNGTLTNSTFEYNYINNIGGLPFFLRNGSGNIIQYNHSKDVCGQYVAAVDHCETIVFWAMSTLDVRFNYFIGRPGCANVVRNGLADTAADSIRIYGNVLSGPGIAANYGNNADWRVFNNSFVNTDGGPFTDGGTQTWTGLHYNNISWNASDSFRPYSLINDYNSYYAGTSTTCDSGLGNNDKGITKVQPADCDVLTVSYNRDPFVNSGSGNYALAAAEDAGTNACTVAGITCDAAIPYDKDWTGATRTNWSRGVLEFGSPGGVGFTFIGGISLSAGASIQ